MATAEVIDFYRYQNKKMNNSKRGHFDIYRSLLEADWATDVFKLSCFIRLIGQAAYKSKTVDFNNREWQLLRGQLVIRISDLAAKLKDRNGKSLSRDSVERILQFFKKNGMINIDGSRHGTLITINNYDKYQNDGIADNAADNEASNNKDSEPTAAVNAAHNNNIAAIAERSADKVTRDNASNNQCSEPYAADNDLAAGAQYEQEVKQELNNKNTMSSPNDDLKNTSLKTELNKSAIDYHAVADLYNEILGDLLPNVTKISEKRRKSIKSLMTRHLNKHTLDAVERYFRAFKDRAKSFYFGDNKTGWSANFDFVIRESTVIAVREGTISRAEFTE